ncbi:MAG: RNA methyltransferase [Erysipelotrichaceae bacterium]|nr:RNA methyltransferase [Erysipelotrichaceae bacterium]
MITSLENKTVKELTKLHQKKYRCSSFLLCDPEMVEAAREHGYLKQLVYTGEIPFEFENSLEVSQEVLNKISKRSDLNCVGVSAMIKENDDYGNRVMILDHLQDPLNIGRIMEEAQLFGFDSLILSEECADIYNEKCIDSCRGGIYTLNICHKDLLNEVRKLKQAGYTVYATGLQENTRELHEVESTEKMAFILGNEGSGVSKQLMQEADGVMKIDMRNIDSLNVGMASAIIMYRFRQ